MKNPFKESIGERITEAFTIFMVVAFILGITSLFLLPFVALIKWIF